MLCAFIVYFDNLFITGKFLHTSTLMFMSVFVYFQWFQHGCHWQQNRTGYGEYTWFISI